MLLQLSFSGSHDFYVIIAAVIQSSLGHQSSGMHTDCKFCAQQETTKTQPVITELHFLSKGFASKWPSPLGTLYLGGGFVYPDPSQSSTLGCSVFVCVFLASDSGVNVMGLWIVTVPSIKSWLYDSVQAVHHWRLQCLPMGSGTALFYRGNLWAHSEW